MSLHTWWVYLATVFLLSATPGPNMLHVMTRSLHFGARRSVAAMAGCLAALVTLLIASAAGLAAVFATFPSAFNVLRYAGVGYLVYLGIKSWRDSSGPACHGDAAAIPLLSSWQLFRGGYLVGVSNPKAILFAAAFLPQFIDNSLPQTPQFVVLIATLAFTDTVWYVIYGAGGQTLSRYLVRPALKRAVDRVTGSVFIGFGLALLRVR